jgi:hypothetical protein
MGSSSSWGHDPRCAVLIQGLDAEGAEHIIRAWYAGRICCGMKSQQDMVHFREERGDLRDESVHHSLGRRMEGMA